MDTLQEYAAPHHEVELFLPTFRSTGELAMATKKRGRASQGRDTPKLSTESAKAVNDAFEGAIAQFERCPRKDTL